MTVHQPAAPHALRYATLAIGVLLASCANTSKPKTAQVQPAYQVKQGGQVDLSYGYIARAKELEADGDLSKAANWWARAIGASPLRADAHQGLGLCLARMGRMDEGVASLREAAALAPHNPRILNNLGHALKLSGDREEALALFKAALKIDPEYAQARYNLAQLEQPDLSLAVSDKASAPVALAGAGVSVGAAASPAPAAAPVFLATQAQPAALSVQHLPNVPALQQVSAAPESAALQLRTSTALSTVAPASTQVAAVVEPAAPAPVAVNLSRVTVEVFNGNGISGAAKGLRQALLKQGVQTSRVANVDGFNVHTTRVVYKPGQQMAARKLAHMLPTSAELVEADSKEAANMRADVRVVLGQNLSPLAAHCLVKAECIGIMQHAAL